MARLDIHLFSELEGCVPRGAYQRFFNERMREFFTSKVLDLSPYLGALPGELKVSGQAETIAKLEAQLRGANVS